VDNQCKILMPVSLRQYYKIIAYSLVVVSLFIAWKIYDVSLYEEVTLDINVPETTQQELNKIYSLSPFRGLRILIPSIERFDSFRLVVLKNKKISNENFLKMIVSFFDNYYDKRISLGLYSSSTIERDIKDVKNRLESTEVLLEKNKRLLQEKRATFKEFNHLAFLKDEEVILSNYTERSNLKNQLESLEKIFLDLTEGKSKKEITFDYIDFQGRKLITGEHLLRFALVFMIAFVFFFFSHLYLPSIDQLLSCWKKGLRKKL
jgi:hypothetical protein